MRNQIKNLIKFILGENLSLILFQFITNYLSKKGNKSYSQEGEDLVLSSLLFKLNNENHKKSGFYIDVGAHHPYRYSNTFLFYKRGWNGLNIDAMPGSMDRFKKSRPRDINLECGIGLNADLVKFYIFNEPALNTFDESLAKARCNDVRHIKTIVKIPIVPLSKVLEDNLLDGQKIDFLTIDVEGFDLDVLKSNDWSKYRPVVVLVETYGKSFEDLPYNQVYKFMRSLNYSVYSKTVNTTFFVDNNFS